MKIIFGKKKKKKKILIKFENKTTNHTMLLPLFSGRAPSSSAAFTAAPANKDVKG